jgi:hypothetical protein
VADIAFVELTLKSFGRPMLLSVVRIRRVNPNVGGDGSIVDYDDGGPEPYLVAESYDDVMGLLARIVPVVSSSAPDVPPPSGLFIDRSTPLRDLHDCGLLNGHSFFPLARAGVRTVGDLAACDDGFIAKLPGVGPVGRRKIESIISRCNGKVGS